MDRNTVQPIQGFTDEELLSQVELQNEIMDTHEDYAALRAAENPNKKQKGMKDKKAIAPGVKGISKLVTEPIYPPKGSVLLSSEFIPAEVFLNTDIVEYNKGKVTYVTDSPSYQKQMQEIQQHQQQKQQQQQIVPLTTEKRWS